MKSETPNMMTVRQIAKTGILSEYALRAMLKEGKLPAIYVGNKALINYDMLCEQIKNLNVNILSGMMQNSIFRGRGLTARFLYCFPISHVGDRKYRSQPIPDEVIRGYDALINNLLDVDCNPSLETPEIITLSKEADMLLEEFANEIEPKLKGEYADIADWAGKLVGAVLRISAILWRASELRCEEFLQDEPDAEVNADIMYNAITIGRYYIEHARAAYSLMGADPVIKQCKYVLNAVKNAGLVEASKRDIMRLCRSFRNADELQPVLDRLTEYGYIAPKSLKQIGDGLMKDGILTAAKKPTWRAEAIKKILQNEKYIGDALLQKTYTVDVLTKKRVKNNGIMPQYYVENNHEAIIPRNLYMQVQEELSRRANLHSGANRKKRVYSSKYALSSICYCPRCGDIYQRIKNTHTASWKCATRVEKGPTSCDAAIVPERELHNAILRGINMILSGRDNMMTKLKENIEQVLLEEDTATITSIDAKLEELQQELIKRAGARQDYEDLADEIDNLREQRLIAMTEKAEREGLKMRIKEMQDFLENQTDRISEYDEQLVRKMIEKITIYDDKFVIEFKSGTNLDVRR